MPRPSNWKSVETAARENGEFCQHEIDDPTVDTDSTKALKARRDCRHVDGHGKTPKQAAVAKDAGSPSVASYNVQAKVLRDMKRNDLRSISKDLFEALEAAGVEPGDLKGTSIEELVDQILKERQRLNRELRKATAK